LILQWYLPPVVHAPRAGGAIVPLDEQRRVNLANWDERVAIHVASREYNAAAFIADPTRISGVVAFDAERLGDVRGKSLLHLQCHFGRDTLSWASLGATVTGLDFSPEALTAARELSAASGVPGRFVEAELYDAPGVLHERFDIVYTGVGALNWLPDVERWAQVVAGFLRPGGVFYLREAHPMLWALDDERDDDLLVVAYPYFQTSEPLRWEFAETYTDGDARLANTVTYEWNHGLGEVIGALLAAGLELTAFDEHRSVEWQALPAMVRADDGRWHLPAGRERLPLMYSLKARRPPVDSAGGGPRAS
jgi:SAM-dependent methyltransferase